MYFAIFDFITSCMAVVFCAAAVKLADDFLDKEQDIRSGQYNWARPLGSSALFYAIICLIVAAGLNPEVSMPLFLASYIVGMFNDYQYIFPSRLTGLQESLIVFILGLCLFGLNSMLFSLSFILAIQLFDDCLDLHRDELAGCRNWAYRFGLTECSLLGTLCLLLAWYFNELTFFVVLCGTVLFYSVIYYQEVAKR
jgi:1,4-dihydroxy-2-naphthoate octaprenyltransferase